VDHRVQRVKIGGADLRIEDTRLRERDAQDAGAPAVDDFLDFAQRQRRAGEKVVADRLGIFETGAIDAAQHDDRAILDGHDSILDGGQPRQRCHCRAAYSVFSTISLLRIGVFNVEHTRCITSPHRAGRGARGQETMMAKKLKMKTKTKTKTKAQSSRPSPTHGTPLHQVRFPGESAKYRTARNALLRDEVALRAQIESVASKR